MLPPRTQGYFLLLVQEKVAKEKDTPDGANTTRASAVPGPGADLTRHPASKIRRGHPVRAPFGALAQNLAVRGRAIRGPKKEQHISDLCFCRLRCSVRPWGAIQADR